MLFADTPEGPAGVFALPSVDSNAHADALFAATVEDLRAHAVRLAGGAAERATPARKPRSSDEILLRPLAVQLEAFLALVRPPDPEASPPTVADLLRQVLSEDRTYWRKRLGELQHTERRAVERGLAQITLVGEVAVRPCAEALLALDPRFGRGPRSGIELEEPLRRLVALYGRGEHTLAPLEPDLISASGGARSSAGECSLAAPPATDWC